MPYFEVRRLLHTLYVIQGGAYSDQSSIVRRLF